MKKGEFMPTKENLSYRALDSKKDNLKINHLAGNFGYFLLGLLCGALIISNIWVWSVR
jgi:hypothetical protein